MLRKLSRSDAKVADAREKLALLEPGGTPERPIVIESASLVEVRAESMTCLRCEGRLDCKEHLAEEIDGAALRVARMQCRACGARRVVYFRIQTTLLN
jgi:DNA-directed RNA polymerase subunit M/transcription elongation factor TFIIS